MTAQPLRILAMGDLSPDSHTAMRTAVMQSEPDVDIRTVDILHPGPLRVPPLVQSVAWRLRVPFDQYDTNRRLLEAVRTFRPHCVYMENVKTVRPETLRVIKNDYGALLVYMSPDYITAPHNSSLWLEKSFRLFDLFFNTKSYGIEKLRAHGIGKVKLIPNNFVPDLHRPMTRDEVGPEYEAFDLVFVGAYEVERARSIRRLAEAGMTVLVHGDSPSRTDAGWGSIAHPNITLRPPAVLEEYPRAMHKGKIALTFLRKLNIDQITNRSMELPGMQRMMLAEKTVDHDLHFEDGREYIGFVDDADLIAKARQYLADDAARLRIAAAGRERCWRSHYDIQSLVRDMLQEIRSALAARTSAKLSRAS